MSLLYTLFLVSYFLGVFSRATPSLPAQSPSEPPRTVCVRRSVLLSFVIPPGSTFVPAVEGSLVVGNITSEHPSEIPSAASFFPSASESPSASLSSTLKPSSTPFLPIHQLENVCNPGLFSDPTGTLYNLTCGWTATGNSVFEGSFPDLQSCAGECTIFRNNGTGCESIIYNQSVFTESQDPNCRGIVVSSNPHAQNQLEFAVPVLYHTTSNATPSAQLPTYSTPSFPATSTTNVLTISTGSLDSQSSGTTSATLSLPSISVSATLSSPISLPTFSSTISSSSLGLSSASGTDSANASTTTSLTSRFSSSSVSSVVSSTVSSTTPSFTSVSSTGSQLSFSPSSSSTSSQPSSRSSSLSATASSFSTTLLSPSTSFPSTTYSLENSLSSSSISTTTSSLENPLSSSSISTTIFSTAFSSSSFFTPSDAPASISTLSSASSFVDITATSPPLIASSTSLTSISSTTILSSTIFSTSSIASITPAPTSDCSYNYLQNGDFQTLVNGLPGPWIFEKDDAYGDATSVSVEEVPHDPPQSPPDNDILMIVNNTDQANPTPSARSVSMSQNIPPLCPGAAYRLFWTNRITINNYNRKRAPVDNQNCTVGFDLLDQVISVMGGPNGAPLPYTQTTSGDIFRYQGYLDHNTLSITLNCTADYGEYHIDDIFFLGPTGSCCSSVSSSATYNTTDYSLSTL